MINPLLIKAGLSILEMTKTGNDEADLSTIKKVFSDNSVPIWKQKKFIVGVFGVVSAAASYFLGLPLESLICAG